MRSHGRTLDDSRRQRQFGRRAGTTLFLLLAAHGMTETARDALLLSKLPVNQLPWMYLLAAIASIRGRGANPPALVRGRRRRNEATIAAQTGPVLLVGYEYGGAVITRAGDEPHCSDEI